jgi:hypothetical protein
VIRYFEDNTHGGIRLEFVNNGLVFDCFRSDNMDKATTSCRVGKSKQEYGKTAKESSGYSESKQKNRINSLKFFLFGVVFS